MKARCESILLLAGAMAGALLVAGQAVAAGVTTRPTTGQAAPDRRDRFVAALPFGQDFQEDAATGESYGDKVALAFSRKWRRVKGFQVVDRYTVADAMAQSDVPRGADIPLPKLQALAAGLAVDYVVFGSAAGAGASKELTVCVYGVKAGKLVLNKQFPLGYWTDLRFAVEGAVSSVTGHTFFHPSQTLALLDPASVAAWKRNPNLVPNPRFRLGRRRRLARWWAVILNKRYNPRWTKQTAAPIRQDVDRMVLWSPAPGDAKAKVLQFAMSTNTAENNGLACYSDWIDVKMGHRYRIAITYRSDGPVFKPFVKGYTMTSGTKTGYGRQRRECYRRQFPDLAATNGQWKTVVVDFVPSVLPPKPDQKPRGVQWVRVDLYCYLKRGHAYVRDVAVKLVETPTTGKGVSDPMMPEKPKPAASRPADAPTPQATASK